ncbi:MAG: PKD domain-containing protein [Planctomycetota bacterium]
MPHLAPRVLFRRRTRFACLGALLLCAVAVATCTKDVGDGVVGRPVRTVPASATDTLVGVDLGATPTAPLRELAIAGASLPRTGAVDLTVAFLAFTTAADAADADGVGTPLDRTSPTATDGNGQSDVFLAAIVNNERTIAGQPVPVAFTQGIAPIFRDQRCVRCHSFHYPGGWREAGHVGALPAATNAECDDCHGSQDVLVSGTAPNSILWLAPDPDRTASPTFDFRGKTDRELYDQVMTLADPKGHMQGDDKILWAIGHGKVPFRPQAFGGRVPMDPQQWQNLIEGWSLAGFPFAPDGAVDDVVLASRRSGGNTAGNGASMQPSVAFEQNASYDPANPTVNRLGLVHVAFASDATDLLGTATANRQVFRTTFEAWLLNTGEVDLRFGGAASVLVSQGTGSSAGGNGDSQRPALDGNGDLCAFESDASDIIAGFVPDPAATRSNVYLREITGGTRTLMSHALGNVLQSGDGDSVRPAISQDNGVVVFESDATDLIASDANAQRDVFLSRIVTTPVVQRVSQATGGVEVVGGASSHASVWRDPGSGVAWVAFESTADFGFGGATPAVLVHRADTGVTLRVGDGGAALREPMLSPDGGKLLFVSSGAVDTVRTDLNGLDDVLGLDFTAFRADGTRRIARESITATGNDGDGASASAAVGGFRKDDGTWLTDQALAFVTTASNLGGSPTSDVVVDFGIDRSVERVAAEFTAEVTRGAIPFAMQFTDLSNNATAWAWDFGDGGTSTQQNPTHTYTVAGTYTVTLTVTGTATSVTATKAAFAQATATALGFSTIFSTYALASNCSTSSCHDSVSPAGSLAMPNATTGRNNLVNVGTVRAGCFPFRVLPGDAANSSLVQRIGNPADCGPRMGSLSPQAVQDIVDWINAGAAL